MFTLQRTQKFLKMEERLSKKEDIILDSIDDFLRAAQAIGPAEKIKRKGEVSLTGKEKGV